MAKPVSVVLHSGGWFFRIGSLWLQAEGRGLPEALSSPRLAMEVSVIVRLAERLAQLLAEGDPLAGRVGLTKADFAWCGLRALGGMPIQRALAFFRAERPSNPPSKR